MDEFMADGGDRVILKDRFEIKPASRLAQFDHGLAQAFAVTDQNQPGRKLFALIAPGTLSCRGLDLQDRKAVGAMLWPEATGIVDWPVGDQNGAAVWGRRPALVYPQPAGQRVAKTDDQPLPHLNEQILARTIIKPAILMLRELGNAGLAHRAIRPTNMFYVTGDSGEVVFGECLSVPPGSEQPAVFETIDNGGADRMGRGAGSIADDFYALGVLLLMLYLGRNPAQGLGDEAIIAAKLDFGSFSALIGGEKVAPAMAEILRGLLADRVSDRWTVRNLDMWMLGQYFNPVLPGLPQRATRPIKFDNADYLSKPALANAMAFHWDEAISITESGTLETWMRRSFNDEKVGEPLNVLRGLAMSYGSSNGVRNRTVSRIIQFMGSQLPVCYRGLRVNISGLGTLLASVIEHPTLRAEFADILRGRLPSGWLSHQPKFSSEMVQMRRALDTVEKTIERQGPGYGVERALYELDAKTPCRSALIGDYYVTGLADLLPAIDAALPGAEAGAMPIDRHIAAFIAARIGRSVERELSQLSNTADQTAYRLGILRMIAGVQRMYPNRDLPRLAEAMVAIIAPVVEDFHNLKTRENLQKRLQKLADQSDFEKMAELLEDDGPFRRTDVQGFGAAVRAHAMLEQEAQWLEGGGLTDPVKVHASARLSSAITASFLASAVIAAYSILMAV